MCLLASALFSSFWIDWLKMNPGRFGPGSKQAGSFRPISVLKILSGNEILTSIKGHNSVATLQKKMTLYNPNLGLVNANVYTNFG